MSAPTAAAASCASVREHLLQLERHVQRAGGAHQRVVLSRAGGAAALGVEPREAGGGDVGERLRVGDLGRRDLARGLGDQDRDAADVAVLQEGDEQRRGDVEALDQLRADRAAVRVRDVERLAARDHGATPDGPSPSTIS